MDGEEWKIVHIRKKTKDALDRAKKTREISYDSYIHELLQYNRSHQIERRITKRLKLFPDV